MGVKAMSWALEAHHEDMTTATKMVLVSLADFANERARCWPSLGLIAERCLMSRRNVQRCIKFLEVHGFVSVERKLRPNGSHSINIYTLNLALETKPNVSGGQCETEPEGRDTVSRGVGTSCRGVGTQCHGGRDTVSPPEEPPNRTNTHNARARGPEGIPDEMRDHFEGESSGTTGRDLSEETAWLCAHWPADRVNDPEVERAYFEASRAGRVPDFETVKANLEAWKRHKDFRDGFRRNLHSMIQSGRLWRNPEGDKPAETRPDPAAKPVGQWRRVDARMLFQEAEKRDDEAGMEEARNIERARWNWRGAA